MPEMRCLYCRKDGGPSQTIEHFIPERLGCGHPFTLPRGAVCDGCQSWASHKVDPAIWEGDRDLLAHLWMCRIPGKKGTGEMKGASGDLFSPASGAASMPDDKRTEEQKKRDDAFLSRSVHKMALGVLAKSTSIETSLERRYDAGAIAMRSGHQFLPYGRAVGRWIDPGAGLAMRLYEDNDVVAVQLHVVTYWASLASTDVPALLEHARSVPGFAFAPKPGTWEVVGHRTTSLRNGFGTSQSLSVISIGRDGKGWIDPRSFLAPSIVQTLALDVPPWRGFGD